MKNNDGSAGLKSACRCIHDVSAWFPLYTYEDSRGPELPCNSLILKKHNDGWNGHPFASSERKRSIGSGCT